MVTISSRTHTYANSHGRTRCVYVIWPCLCLLYYRFVQHHWIPGGFSIGSKNSSTVRSTPALCETKCNITICVTIKVTHKCITSQCGVYRINFIVLLFHFGFQFSSLECRKYFTVCLLLQSFNRQNCVPFRIVFKTFKIIYTFYTYNAIEFSQYLYMYAEHVFSG